MKKLILFLILISGTLVSNLGSAETPRHFLVAYDDCTDPIGDSSWNATHYDIILEDCYDYDGVIRAMYNSFSSMMVDTSATDHYYTRTTDGKYDSLMAWRSSDYENTFLHFDKAYMVKLSYRVLTLFPGWSVSNDVGSNDTNDYTADYGLATRQGLNYLVDTLKSWSSWVGYGVYDIDGNLIDTVEGGGTDSIYWDRGDTSNIMANWSFENGDPPDSYYAWGGVTLSQSDTNYEGSYSCLINSDADGLAYARQIRGINSGDEYFFRIWYKTDSDTARLLVTKGSDAGSGLMNWYIVPESADGEWHTYCDTFATTGEDSVRIKLGFEDGADTNDSMWIDAVTVYPLGGYLPQHTAFGQSGYPYIIADLAMPAKTAPAQERLDARILHHATDGRYWMNLSDTGYRAFERHWIATVFDIRDGFEAYFNDEISNGIPAPLNERTCVEGYTADSQWYNDEVDILDLMNDSVPSGKFLYANITPMLDSTLFSLVDGGMIESGISPVYPYAESWDSLQRGRWGGANQYQLSLVYFNKIARMNKVVLAMSKFGDYEVSLADTNRLRVTAYAWYLLTKGDSSAFLYTWTANPNALEDDWERLYEMDLGSPIDTAYEFTSGTDADGQDYVIGARMFAGSTMGGIDTILVLYKPPYSSVTATVLANTTTTTHSLNGVWSRLKADGNFEPGLLSEVSLRFLEAAILCKMCE